MPFDLDEVVLGLSLPAGLTVRGVSVADARLLAAFFQVLASDPDTVRFFHPHPLTPEFAIQLCSRSASGRDGYYLWCYHGLMVGYSMLRGWDEGHAVPSFGCCVHPEVRGTGLGQLLLEHAVAQARAAGSLRLRLTVYKANTRAIHVYRKIGFHLVEKNDREWVGMLDLTSAPRPLDSILNDSALDAWAFLPLERIRTK